jgi:hypothetical protein
MLRSLAKMVLVYPPRGGQGEPLPWPELEWRQSPPLGSSLPRVRAHAMAAHVAGDGVLLPIEPMNVAPESPLLCERLMPPK